MLKQVAIGTRNRVHKWYGTLPEDWFDNLKPFPDGTPRHDGPRTFMEPLSSAWKWEVLNGGFRVFFDEKRKEEGKASQVWGLRLQQYGDTIRPVEKRALTIPVTAEARNRSVRRFEQETGKKLFVVKGKNKSPEHIGSLVWEDPAGALHAAFVLRKSAEVKPLKERRGHDAIPSKEQMAEWAATEYKTYIMNQFYAGY